MPEAAQILKKYWGYDGFKPLQEEIIKSVSTKRDTLALLPTGGGKSICYQVPALSNDGFCLVISPLISLMQDQVSRLKAIGVQAEYIHAGMYYHDVTRVLQNMLHGPIKLLYISPERLQTDLFQEYLPEFNINLIAVDEAHCISQWGHDFRPDYLKIVSLRSVFPEVPVLALTASAPREVQADIQTQLLLKDANVYKASFERPNIFYEVRYSDNKIAETAQATKQQGSSIVYCRSRKQTENVAKSLQQNSINAGIYHAGIPKDNRHNVQISWMQNETPVMVATTAFGMGIDKAAVHLVLHYDAPEHLEAYYQEAGRAGRNGKASTALALFNSKDIKRLKESTIAKFPPEAYLRDIYQAVNEYLQIAIGTEPEQYFDFDLGDFCKRFDFQAVPASNALKLLEQEGLWTLSDAVFHPATIQFITDRRNLDQLLNIYPDLGYVTTGLLRLYSNIFQYPIPVRMSNIARHLKLDKQLLEQLILQLDKMELLKYNKPKDCPQLFFHHLRVDSKHLHLDLQRILRLRKQHEARTKAMIHFLENTSICREKILLEYFGEEISWDCGHCDVCKNKRVEKIDTRELKIQILTHLQQHSDLNLQGLAVLYPNAIKEQLIALVRQMMDEEIVSLLPSGVIKYNN